MKPQIKISVFLLTATVVSVYFYVLYSQPKDTPDSQLPSLSESIEQIESIQETLTAEQVIAPQADDIVEELVDEEAVSPAESQRPYQFWHDAQAILRASYRPEDLVVAAIYDQVMDPDLGGNNIAQAEDSLLRAFNIAPDNELVNHQILSFCSKNPEYTICSLPYAYNLLEADGNNATMLNELADVYYKNFDFNQAFTLINKAALVEHSDNYYSKYIAAIDKALLDNRIRFMHTRQNLNLYPRLAAASVNANFSNVIKMCDERVSMQLEQWRIACRDAGKNIADRSLDTVSRGYGVRQFVRYAGLSSDQQDKAILQVAIERAKIIESLEQETKTFNKQIPFNVWEQFITDMQKEGESTAYKNLEQKMAVYQRYFRSN